MKIVIVGCGTVGLATGKLLEKNHEVRYVDITEDKEPKPKLKIGSKWCKFTEGDIYFICTPEDKIEEVFAWIPLDKLIVIRSTCLPETCSWLTAKYDCHVCHLPCFSREADLYMEELYTDRVVIGKCCMFHGEVLELLWREAGVKSEYIVTDTVTSELSKLIANGFLATHISFWNEMAKICKLYNREPSQVADIVTKDRRVGYYGTAKFDEPFSGKCLPKDLNHLLTIFPKNKLLKAVKRVNDQYST